EGHETGVFQLQFAGLSEELLVLRIRSRPAAFDVIDAKLVELVNHQDLVVRGEANSLALSAVAQGCVERENSHRVTKPPERQPPFSSSGTSSSDAAPHQPSRLVGSAAPRASPETFCGRTYSRPSIRAQTVRIEFPPGSFSSRRGSDR